MVQLIVEQFIDAPVHRDPDGKNLDAYPISDWCISDCLTLILSLWGIMRHHKQMLERATQPLRINIAIRLYNLLPTVSDGILGAREFWDNSCWVSADEESD